MNIRKYSLLLATILCLLSAKSDGTLPKVLIIGDSISIGYTPSVKSSLADVAQVIHSPGNAGDSNNGLAKLDRWLGDTPWKVIYFNFGMWDYCYRHPESKTQGNRDKINGTLTSTVEQYAANLDSIATKLKRTGATVIFATSTFVPSLEAGRHAKDVAIYNAAALAVMKKHGIPVDDLYTLSLSIHPKHGLGEDDVHYTPEGYSEFGKQVVKTIGKYLR